LRNRFGKPAPWRRVGTFADRKTASSPKAAPCFLETVPHGRKRTQMPAFGLRLSPDEVWQIHAFIESTDHY
jgi:mono/diheme cytochrome c family protein